MRLAVLKRQICNFRRGLQFRAHTNLRFAVGHVPCGAEPYLLLSTEVSSKKVLTLVIPTPGPNGGVKMYKWLLSAGTREQAFVSALSAASVVHAIAKACAAGFLQHCNCGPMPNEPPAADYKWGGCGDDVAYGMKLGRFFTDIPWSQKFHITYSKNKEKPAWKKNRVTKAALNLHNQDAGRRVVEESLARHCKCHGVSGSCQIRTCWKSLPPMKEISDRLFRNYKRAVEVSNITHV